MLVMWVALLSVCAHACAYGLEVAWLIVEIGFGAGGPLVLNLLHGHENRQSQLMESGQLPVSLG